MSVKEYTLNFTQLSRYAPKLVGNMRAHMRKFAFGLSNDLVLECKGAMLNWDMDFSRFFVDMQQVEEQKKRVAEAREKHRQAKKARSTDQNNSLYQGGNWGNRWSKKKFWSNAQSSASALVPWILGEQRFQSGDRPRALGTQSQGCVAQTYRAYPCYRKCGKDHPGLW